VLHRDDLNLRKLEDRHFPQIYLMQVFLLTNIRERGKVSIEATATKLKERHETSRLERDHFNAVVYPIEQAVPLPCGGMLQRGSSNWVMFQ
jgi:hypothetical protein